MLESITKTFRDVAPQVDFWSLSLVDDRYEALSVRQDILRPVTNWRSAGSDDFRARQRNHGLRHDPRPDIRRVFNQVAHPHTAQTT